MDAFLLYSLFFTVLYASLSIIYFITKPNTSKPNVPPGSTGWPVVGESIDMMLSGPEKYISDRMKKYSLEVFKTSILGEKVAVFCGAAANKFLFTNENTLLTTWWPQSVVKPLLFPTDDKNTVKNFGDAQPDPRPRDSQTGESQTLHPHPGFHCQGTNRRGVGPIRRSQGLSSLQILHLRVGCKLFLNIEGRDEVTRLLDPFIIVSSSMFSLPLNLPGTAYNRGMKAGSVMRRQLLEVIKERKAKAMMSSSGKAEEEERDVLGRLLSATNEEGQHMNEVEIYHNIVGLLLPSYHSTSAAITFILKYLAELPHIYQQVYKTFWNVYSTHKDPKYFTEPENFDPSRFEGNGPAPFTYVPFGSGLRMCPGKEWARLIVLVFMHNVVTNFKMEKLMLDEKIVYYVSPVPVNGLPVKLTPHQN
nr:beta-amyrin 28-oxidase-like [Ipomoea batatas]GME21359.1 beta-amyrin 28-oxidase-like [Ipomoea batatas]